MTEIQPKEVIKKLFVTVAIIQALLIGLTLLLFPHPDIFAESFRDWAQKLLLIVLVEAIIWPIIAFRISIRYERIYSSAKFGKAIKYLLFSPYLFIGGILIGVAFFSSPPPDKGKHIGTYYWKRSGKYAGEAYENDKSNRTDKIIGIALTGVLIIGGIGCWKAGITKIYKLDESDVKDNSENTFSNKEIANEFKEITIGNKIWMSKNLNTAFFRNGDAIPIVSNYFDWTKHGKQGKPACCVYENKSENGDIYGMLYNWYAVNDSRELAPKGWHIPDESEWRQTIDSIGGRMLAGIKMKSTDGWNSIAHQSGVGNNESGFDGLPGGIRQRNGRFKYAGYLGYWWSSNNYNKKGAWFYRLNYQFKKIVRSYEYKQIGMSIRCVKD